MMHTRKTYIPILFAAFAAALFCGCAPEKKIPPPEPAKNIQPPAVRASKPGDFFPLDKNRSWKYVLTDCGVPFCPDKKIDSLISSVKKIEGRDVYTLSIGMEAPFDCRKCEQCPKECEPFLKDKTRREMPVVHSYQTVEQPSGYMDGGEYVYFVMFDKDKIIRKEIAGKHNLRPGDSWKKKIASASAPRQKGKTPDAGITIAEREVTLKCGEKQAISLPKNEPASIRFNAICCRSEKDPSDNFQYSACFAAGIGLVAEYYPKASSEIISYGVR